jgi:hypothetical protein
MSEKQSKNMKTILKVVLTTVGVVLATTAARAGSETETEDIFVTVGSGAGDEIAVASTVSWTGTAMTAPYTYSYALTQLAGSGGIDAFTVFSLGNPFSADGITPGSIEVNGVSTPTSTWSAGVNGGHLSWSVNLNPVVDQSLPITFSYVAPGAPAQGYTGATDGGTYQPSTLLSNEVYVPTLPPPPVPDGGLTATLLGGAFLGLGALRRKIG